MTSSPAISCRELVEKVITTLAAVVYRSIMKDEPLRLDDAKNVIGKLEKSLSKCADPNLLKDNIYIEYLVGELDRISSMLLDKAMEALSKHMELLKIDAHNILSAALTNYAVHETRVVTAFMDILKRYYKKKLDNDNFASIILRTMEEEVYSAVARFIAVTRLVSLLSSDDIEEILPKLVNAIEFFIREEERTILLAVYHVKTILG